MLVLFVHIGFLDLSSDSKDLKSGTKLELPLWLAEQLYVRNIPISIDIPKTYKERYRYVCERKRREKHSTS